MNSSLPEGGVRLLVVVAHPHDITHMLGTCGHHRERGDRVTVVSATGGVHTHNEKLYDELRKAVGERDMGIVGGSAEAYGEQKGREMREACGLFGISDVRILSFPDVGLEVTEELVEGLAEVLYEVRPQILLTHAPYAQVQKGHASVVHNDHVATGIAVHRALVVVGIPEYGSERRPHQVAAIYYTGVDFSPGEVDLYIDMSDQAGKRLQAEKLFLSQGHTPEMARKRIEIGCGAWGWSSGVAYAEPFVRGRREVGGYLTVTEHDLRAAEEPHKERLARISQQI